MINKSCLLFVMSLWLTPFMVSAEEVEEEKLNPFGFPDQSVITIIEAGETADSQGASQNMPDCNNDELLTELREHLLPYLDNGETNIRERRRIDLTLKNLKNFEQLNISEVNTQKDTIAADRIIELKINQKKRASDIKICKVDSKVIGVPIYIVMYYEGDALQAEVLNFTNKENPKFVFIPKHE